MQIEYEATFTDIEPSDIRERLQKLDAECVRSEFIQRRSVFFFPRGNEILGGWVRVRDEGNKITLSIKIVDGDKIQNQKESCITVDDYQRAEEILQTLGCIKKAYQENKRELWKIDDTEVTIDTWPFLEPFVEIEGKNEESIRAVSEKLGFVWSDAKFCAVDTLYSKKYSIPEQRVNDETPRVVFGMENPFK